MIGNARRMTEKRIYKGLSTLFSEINNLSNENLLIVGYSIEAAVRFVKHLKDEQSCCKCEEGE